MDISLDDLERFLKGATIHIGTINIQGGTNNEFYAAPVQVNQQAEPLSRASAAAIDMSPRYYHCSTCTYRHLSESAFTWINDLPYCSTCYAELFAPPDPEPVNHYFRYGETTHRDDKPITHTEPEPTVIFLPPYSYLKDLYSRIDCSTVMDDLYRNGAARAAADAEMMHGWLDEIKRE